MFIKILHSIFLHFSLKEQYSIHITKPTKKMNEIVISLVQHYIQDPYDFLAVQQASTFLNEEGKTNPKKSIPLSYQIEKSRNSLQKNQCEKHAEKVHAKTVYKQDEYLEIISLLEKTYPGYKVPVTDHKFTVFHRLFFDGEHAFPYVENGFYIPVIFKHKPRIAIYIRILEDKNFTKEQLKNICVLLKGQNIHFLFHRDEYDNFTNDWPNEPDRIRNRIRNPNNKKLENVYRTWEEISSNAINKIMM